MGYVNKKQQGRSAGKRCNGNVMSSDRKGLPARFSNKQIVSAWRELPDKDRLMVFLIDMRKLGIERTAEIMNKPVTVVVREVRQARVLLKKELLAYCRSSRTYRE